MYNKIILGLLALPVFIQAEPILIDQGLVVVSGPVANTMITHSDVYDKRNLENSVIPLEQQIKMEAIRQQTIVDKMPIDDTAADKYLARLRKSNDLSEADLEEIATSLGRTMEELHALLDIQYMYDFFLHHKFRVRLVPTDQEVEEYCQSNPEYESGWFTITTASLPYSQEDEKAVAKQVERLSLGKGVDKITWSKPLKIDERDLADNKKFIQTLKIGQVYADKQEGVFDLYKLLEKQEPRLKTLNERKADIIDVLNKKLFVEKLAAYEKELMKSIAVVHLT